MTNYDNDAAPRCAICQEELHPGLNGNDHAPDCPQNPENWKGKQTVC
jgi:hypothetical protein